MKCDRRWYNDGRVRRDAEEQQRRDDKERGVERYYNDRGQCVLVVSPSATIRFPPDLAERLFGFDANGSPVE